MSRKISRRRSLNATALALLMALSPATMAKFAEGQRTFRTDDVDGRYACRDTSSTRRARHCLPTLTSLGLDLPLSDDLSPLFQPHRGGRPVDFGNRLAIQPMEGCDGELDGSPGELTFRRFQRFGAGGAKLIWGEACAVVPEDGPILASS